MVECITPDKRFLRFSTAPEEYLEKLDALIIVSSIINSVCKSISMRVKENDGFYDISLALKLPDRFLLNVIVYIIIYQEVFLLALLTDSGNCL